MSQTAQQPAVAAGAGVLLALPVPRGPRRPQPVDAAERLDRREALLHRLELDRHRRRGTRLSRSA